MKLVIDANVAVKWYIDEEHSELARGISRAAPEMHVPDFFYEEVANTFWKRARRAEIDAADVSSWLNSLIDVQAVVHDSRSLVQTAWQIAGGTAMAVYDAAYLAVAREQKCPVVTADRLFFRQARVSGHSDLVRWIDDPNLLFAS